MYQCPESGSASGSVSQKYGSEDPDPHPDLYQNVTDGSEDPHPDLYQNVTDPLDWSDQNPYYCLWTSITFV
jgi:hypothetical protein